MWREKLAILFILTVRFLGNLEAAFYDDFNTAELDVEKRDEIYRNLLLHKNPSYFALIPNVVRAGSPYRIVVNVLPGSPPLIVEATLMKNNIQIDSMTKECDRSQPQIFSFMVPNSAGPGLYRLKLEGNEIGWLTGSAFANETTLEFSARGATVFIQMEKKIYRPATTVKFRVVVLNGALSLVEDPVDVIMLSPRGVIVKRWLFRQCLEGAISLSFELSDVTDYGMWKVRVEATNSFAEENFKVENFQPNLFEVSVDVQEFIPGSSEYIDGRVTANYVSGAPVAGNISIWATVKPLSRKTFSYYKMKPAISRKNTNFNGFMDFRFSISELREYLIWSPSLEVRITAQVGEVLFSSIENGFSTLRIFPPKLHLRFLGEPPFIIQPTMPFQYYLMVSTMSGAHIPVNLLYHHRMSISTEVRFKMGYTKTLEKKAIKMKRGSYGLWHDELDLSMSSKIGLRELEKEVESVTLRAELKTSDGKKARAAVVLVPKLTDKHRYIHVTTSTENPRVGEFLILHVRSNFYVNSFRYAILSKGLLVSAGQERMEASLMTFPLALTPDMAGGCTVLIYSLQRDTSVIADAISLPVDALTNEPLKISLDKTSISGGVHIRVNGDPGSKVSLVGVYKNLFRMNKLTEITKNSVTQRILKDSQLTFGSRATDHFSKWRNSLVGEWFSHHGFDDYAWLPRSSFGADANDTLRSIGLNILSDGAIAATRRKTCRKNDQLRPCLLSGCFSSGEKCDGTWNCRDGLDETECDGQESLHDSKVSLDDFYLNRKSRLSREFDSSWLWREITLDSNGSGLVTVMAPERPSNMMVSAFSLHPVTRMLSLMEQPVTIHINPPFWIWVEAPKTAYVWEQVGVRVTIVNGLKKQLPATVLLAQSKSYRFVSLEEFSQTFPEKSIKSFPKRSIAIRENEHQHSIVIPGLEARTIYLPIVPVVPGEIIVTVYATIPGAKISRTTILTVEPIGIEQEHHTSFLIDLRKRAYLFTFLETIGPTNLDVNARTTVKVSIFGDFIGGGIRELLQKSEKEFSNFGCEAVTFKILAIVQRAKHLKRAKQDSELDDKLIADRISVLYQNLLHFQNSDGGFKYFSSSSTSSVWLTALSLRSLAEASNFWQRLVFVDPQVTDRAVKFLLRHQTTNGGFWNPVEDFGVRYLEALEQDVILDYKTGALNLSTTAITILQLMKLKDLPMPLDQDVLEAINKGRWWLEQNLNALPNGSPFEISAVALVLELLDSNHAQRAFDVLARKAIHRVTKFIYWGVDTHRTLDSFNPKSKLPLVRPRLIDSHDSGNVAATALALRVYAARKERLTIAVVRWLEAHRYKNGGWMSDMDTFFASEALYEYSRYKNEAAATYMRIIVDGVPKPKEKRMRPKMFTINADNVMDIQNYEIKNFESNLRVQAKGNGSAVLQLTSKYFVTEPVNLQNSSVKSFYLKTKALASGANSSTLTFTSCVKWICEECSQASGISVLEISIPTGYQLNEEVQKLVNSKKQPYLKAVYVDSRRVYFYFEKITRKMSCVTFRVDRRFPVANLTKVLAAKVYEYHSPEMYAIELLDMSSVTLDICEVCGSYQCPNCPILSYYSSGSQSIRNTVAFKTIFRSKLFQNVGSLILVFVFVDFWSVLW